MATPTKDAIPRTTTARDGHSASDPSTESAGDEQQLQITILRADDLPKSGLQRSTSRYYVTLTIGNQSRRTHSFERRSGPTWNQTFSLAFVPSSVLSLRLFAAHRFQPDEAIAGIDKAVSGLLACQQVNEPTITLALQSPDKKKSKKSVGSIAFRVIVSAPDVVAPGMDDGLAEVETSLVNMDFMSQAGSTALESEPGPWVDLIKCLKDFDATPIVKALDAVAEVHPYTKAAWSIISFSFRVMLDQRHRDEAVDDLGKVMRDMYVLVQESDPLKEQRALKHIVITLSKQTIECAYFIQRYATDQSFFNRAVTNLFSDADYTITQYHQQFDKLREMLQVLAVVGSAAVVQELDVVVRCILERVDSIPSLAELSNLPYVEGVGFVPEKCCLRGTRVQVLDDIIQWVSNDEGGSNIFLLTGIAGCGKSSIAHTIALHFSRQKRLGSSFFFQRGYQGRDRPDHVFSTIARDLADHEPVVKQRLCDIIKNNRSLAGTNSFTLQFQEFIVKPTSESTVIGPIVIVIDALDECEGPLRRQFLRRLATGLTELPRNYRVILTARPEDDILSEFHTVPHKTWQLMENVDVKLTYQDISAFIHHELSEIRRWPPTIDLAEAASKLTELSRGLFIWASTVCKFVKGDNEKGYVFSDKRLERVLNLATPPGVQRRIDELYSTVLATVFSWDEDDSHQPDFLSAIGIVITIRIPLPVPAIVALTGDRISGIETHLGCMGALLNGVASESIPVRALHPSFGDYLSDQSRSGVFFVDPKSVNVSIATMCVEFMLKYIECDLCAAHDERDSDSTPTTHYNQETLQYACRFWVSHLCAVDVMEDAFLQSQLDFMMSHLSRWLEIIGTWWDVGLAHSLTAELLEWLETRLPHDKGPIMSARALLNGIPLSCIPQSLNIQCTAVGPKPFIHGGAAEFYGGHHDGQKVVLKLYRDYVERMDGRYVRLPGTRRPTEVKIAGFQVCREALLWKQLRHPNILPLLGVDPNYFLGRLCLVSPWVHNGNIAHYMQDPANLGAHAGRCLLEIANAVKYLHSVGISHGCLDCRSVLIGNNGNVLLTGFGWAQFERVLDRHFETDNWAVVAFRSVAPELLKGGPSFQTRASDVYAFGCVCIEVYTGNVPFPEIPDRMVFSAIDSGRRPLSARPAADSRKEMPCALWSIVESCWNCNRNDRPSIDEVVKGLQHIPNF